MGMLNRLLGQAGRTSTPTSGGRSRRSPGRGRPGRQTPAPRGLGGIAQKLMGGRRRGI